MGIKLYIYLALALAVVAVVGAQEVRVRMAQAETAEAVAALDAYQAAAAKVIAERLAENSQIERQQARQIEEAKRASDNRLASVRDRYERELARLRQPRPDSGGGTVPEDGTAPGGGDGASAEQRFVEALRGCEEDRERLRLLQQWASTITQQ